MKGTLYNQSGLTVFICILQRFCIVRVTNTENIKAMNLTSENENVSIDKRIDVGFITVLCIMSE